MRAAVRTLLIWRELHRLWEELVSRHVEFFGPVIPNGIDRFLDELDLVLGVVIERFCAATGVAWWK